MKAYSSDLRARVLGMARDTDITQPQLAALFGLSLSTVEEWLRVFRQTGRTEPLPHAGGATRALQPHAQVIRQVVKQQPDVRLAELCTRVAAKTGTSANPSMMCRELQILHLPRKKITARQSTRNRMRPKIATSAPPQDYENPALPRRTPKIHR
jgi:transposase